MADVDGQPVALITGASSGIGERLAYEIAADQYILVLVSDMEGELNRVAGILTSKLNASVVALPVDLSKHDAGDVIEDELRASPPQVRRQQLRQWETSRREIRRVLCGRYEPPGFRQSSPP